LRIINRMEEKVEQFNKKEGNDALLAFSCGIEIISADDYGDEGLKLCQEQRCREKQCGTPQCLIGRADRKMYANKRLKKINFV